MTPPLLNNALAVLSSMVISAIVISLFVFVRYETTIVQTKSKLPSGFSHHWPLPIKAIVWKQDLCPQNAQKYLFSIYTDEQITTNCANQKLRLLKRSCRAHSLLLTIGHTTHIHNSQSPCNFLNILSPMLNTRHIEFQLGKSLGHFNKNP